MSMLTSICFIVCHGGPADHFATYAEVLTKKGYPVQIHATGVALEKLQARGVKVDSAFSLNADEDTIAKTCSAAAIIITDVGHPFDVNIQKALASHAPQSRRFAYYDNLEPFVPGGYSSTAAEVINLAEGVLFANDRLANAPVYRAVGQEIDFGDKKRYGIGYYPIRSIGKAEHANARAAFLKKNGIEDRGQKIYVYFGANNEEYFSKAFPAFLSIVAQADLQNAIIVLQQHPGAKERNLDGQQIKASQAKILISDFSSDEAQVLADGAFYYQTSMAPQIVLEGIPAIQIGHEIYEDLLVRNHFVPAVTNVEELKEAITTTRKVPQQDLLTVLGINEDWPTRLEDIIKAIMPSSNHCRR